LFESGQYAHRYFGSGERERERELVGQLFTMGMGIERAREI